MDKGQKSILNNHLHQNLKKIIEHCVYEENKKRCLVIKLFNTILEISKWENPIGNIIFKNNLYFLFLNQKR
jgi:hypothetical protein